MWFTFSFEDMITVHFNSIFISEILDMINLSFYCQDKLIICKVFTLLLDEIFCKLCSKFYFKIGLQEFGYVKAVYTVEFDHMKYVCTVEFDHVNDVLWHLIIDTVEFDLAILLYLVLFCVSVLAFTLLTTAVASSNSC